MAQKFPLPKLPRPQEPLPPYPYEQREVSFASDGAQLSGTLTLPSAGGKFPVVILVHGSGPHNRDEVVLGHKIFKVIADRITRAGVAVLRYDKRGIERSTGEFKSADINVFAADVNAAIAFLKTCDGVDAEQIGLVGHSEGGTVSLAVASKSMDVRFVASLAGMAVNGLDLALFQIGVALKEQGLSKDRIAEAVEFSKRKFGIVRDNPDNAVAAQKLRSFYAAEIQRRQTIWDRLRWLNFWNRSGAREEQAAQQAIVDLEVSTLLSPWVRTYLSYDPRASIEAVRCPILALNGELDMQVPADWNLQVFRDAISVSGNKELTTMKLLGLNHLFQTCKTGSVSEYAQIEETFSPVALDALVNWLLAHTRRD